jgi:hypothetical protein
MKEVPKVSEVLKTQGKNSFFHERSHPTPEGLTYLTQKNS